VSRWRSRDRDQNPSRLRWDLRPSRPRSRLQKTGVETCLKTETKSRDSITGCSLSVSIVLNVRFTTNGICVMNNTRVPRTSRNKISTTCYLYCWLVPQSEGLHTCCSAFPITTKRCFDQHVKMVPGTTFTKRTCNRCGLLKKRGMLLQPLGWGCIESVVIACPKEMTRDEHVLGFKHYDFSMYWLIWKLWFLLIRN